MMIISLTNVINLLIYTMYLISVIKAYLQFYYTQEQNNFTYILHIIQFNKTIKLFLKLF